MVMLGNVNWFQFSLGRRMEELVSFGIVSYQVHIYHANTLKQISCFNSRVVTMVA